MNVTETFFVIQFLVFIVIFIFRFYNIMKLGEIYDLKIGFVLFVSSLLAYAVGSQVLMSEVEEYLYIFLLQLQGWMIVPQIAFLFAEIFFHLRLNTKKVISHYKPMKFDYNRVTQSRR